MAKHNNAIQEFLDLLSEFSTVKKISNGKKTEYIIPNLLDGKIPNISKIKELTNTADIIISNSNEHEITLIF